jgi:D-alanyl-D-alanine carboxypeptidase (penicillin-binding protein 5/6)
VLLEYALKNETFRRIFTSEIYTTSPSSAHPDGITMYSTMFKNLDKNQLENGEIIGGKTGYTSEAGLCLASLAKLDDKEYILVTAGADGNHKTEQYNITDAITIYDRMNRN